MKVKYDGQYIRIENDWNNVRSLKCSCGHLLKDHYFHNLEGSAEWIEVGSCKVSDHCKQFRVSKVQARNFSYA